MKIENWERTDVNRNKIIWRHTTGVTIVLSPESSFSYKLVLYDKAGREHYRVGSPNKTVLEKESARWQRDYNRHLKRT